MAITYTFQVGETIRIPLLRQEGESAQVENLRANLKLTKGSKQIPDLSAPVAATCEVYEADGGWILEISANKTAVLKPGTYALNAAMEVAGQTFITDPSYINLTPTTTV